MEGNSGICILFTEMFSHLKNKCFYVGCFGRSWISCRWPKDLLQQLVKTVLCSVWSMAGVLPPPPPFCLLHSMVWNDTMKADTMKRDAANWLLNLTVYETSQERLKYILEEWELFFFCLAFTLLQSLSHWAQCHCAAAVSSASSFSFHPCTRREEVHAMQEWSSRFMS